MLLHRKFLSKGETELYSLFTDGMESSFSLLSKDKVLKQDLVTWNWKTGGMIMIKISNNNLVSNIGNQIIFHSFLK